jgi:hypothetical protein
MSSMDLNKMSSLAPLATPLPDPPAGEAFTPNQWTTLLAIMDALIPSVQRDSTSTDEISQYTISDAEYNMMVDHLKKTLVEAPDSEALDEYLQERPSEDPKFQDLLKRTLIHYSPDDVRKGLAFILSTLK